MTRSVITCSEAHASLFRRGDEVWVADGTVAWVWWVDPKLGTIEVADRKPGRIRLWLLALAEAIGWLS